MTAPVRSDPAIVNVPLGDRAYEIVIGRGVLTSLGHRVAALRPKAAAAAIVTDENVKAAHLGAAEAALGAAALQVSSVVVAPGEASKSWSTLEKVCETLLTRRLERGDVIVALGGGVVGDLAGFVAAILRRGIDVVQVPTTLLAQVDSAIGGKTGINSAHGHGKNLIGAIRQPVLVVADTMLLDTLPARMFRAGYAEVVKYGLINDARFFDWLDVNWREVFAGGPAREHAIEACCGAKTHFVVTDELETGDRRLLNLGHTFGHALEAAAGFSDRLLHGEAVAIGTSLAFAFSARRGMLSGDVADQVRRHLAMVGLPTHPSEIPGPRPSVDQLMDLMAQDKKVSRGELTFILAEGIGASRIVPGVDPAAVRAFLSDTLAER